MLKEKKIITVPIKSQILCTARPEWHNALQTYREQRTCVIRI